MKEYYNLRLAEKTDTGVKICFWSNEKCNLKVIRAKFFFEPRKANEYRIDLTPIFLDNDGKECFFQFPDDKCLYTSLNFIVKDETHKTQYAVQLPLDGSAPQFTQMQYGE